MEQKKETPGPITILMLKHHGIVNRSLGNFEKELEKAFKSDNAKYALSIFRWNLQKHFFIEEKNIFIVTDKENKTEFLQLQNFLKDHRDLMSITNNITEDILEGRKPQVIILRELLFAHERRETDIFYPRLDRRLSEEEKKEIIEKTKDVKLD